jgi:hypothetical protein
MVDQPEDIAQRAREISRQKTALLREVVLSRLQPKDKDHG